MSATSSQATAVLVAALLPLSAAHAKPPVRVEAPAIEGAIPTVWPERLHARVLGGFRAAGVEVEPEAEVVAALSIVADGRDFELRLRLRGADDDATVATLVDTCDTCGFAELAERVDAVTASAVAALDKAEPRPATATLRSVPAGAAVFLDGTALGSTPLETTIAPGEHTLAIELDGHRAHTREVEFAAGEVVAFDVALSPTRTRRERALRGVAGAGIGVGLGAVAAGATLLWLHGRPIRRDCAADNVDASGECRYLHDTRAAGATMTALGGAGAIAGAVIIGILSAKRRPRAAVAVSPRSSGIEVRF